MIEKIKQMIAFEQGETKRLLADEDIQEFERVYHSNKAVAEVVTHLYDFAVLVNNGSFNNWWWINHIAILYKNKDDSLKDALGELNRQLADIKPMTKELN